MNEELPEELKVKIARKLLAQSRAAQQRVRETEDPERVVWSVLKDDRARELMEKAKALYPREYTFVVSALYDLIKRGQIKELDGYTVLVLLRRLGINVRPELRIKFVKDGKEVGFEDYVD